MYRSQLALLQREIARPLSLLAGMLQNASPATSNVTVLQIAGMDQMKWTVANGVKQSQQTHSCNWTVQTLYILECLTSQFDCGDGQCVFEWSLCSGTAVCDNGRDEENCGGNWVKERNPIGAMMDIHACSLSEKYLREFRTENFLYKKKFSSWLQTLPRDCIAAYADPFCGKKPGLGIFTFF